MAYSCKHYLGSNATQVVQALTARAEFLGTGNGQPNQVYNLVNAQVVDDSIVLEVEDQAGWQGWKSVAENQGNGAIAK